MLRPASNIEKGILLVDSVAGMNPSVIAHVDGAVDEADRRG